jgi:hypothetical protein
MDGMSHSASLPTNLTPSAREASKENGRKKEIQLMENGQRVDVPFIAVFSGETKTGAHRTTTWLRTWATFRIDEAGPASARVGAFQSGSDKLSGGRT